MIGTNVETPTRRITEWIEFQENEVGTKKQLQKTLSL